MGECEAGREYMIAVGFGWMFVGRFVRPAGMFGGVFDRVRNICRTGGVPWDDLCRGRRRDEATIRAYPDGEVCFPSITFAVPWADD